MPRKAQNDGLFRRRDYHTNEPKGCWYLPISVNGKKFIRSTGKEDLSEAKASIPFVVAALMKELGEEDSQRTSRKQWRLSDLFENAIRFHETSGGALNTVRGYQLLQKLIQEFFGNVHLEMLNQDGIRRYANFRMKTSRKPTANSVASELTKLVAALQLAKAVGAYAGEPKALIPPEFKFRRLAKKRFLNPIEISNLFAALEEHGYARIVPHIRTYLYLGLRKEELWKIKVSHVNLLNRTILVPGTKTTSSYQTLPLPEALVEEFSRRMEGKNQEEFLFERIGIWHMVRNATTKAKIPHVSIHDLRRTTGSLLVSAGANLKVVQQVLRHQSMEVTARHYGHLTPNVLPSEMNKLSSLIEPLPLPAAE